MDIEQITSDLVDFLKENMPAQLAAIEAVKTDLKLGRIDEYITHDVVDLDRYKKPTNLFVIWDDTNFESGSNIQTLDSKTNISLYLTMANQTSANLTKKMVRYIQAITTLFANNTTLDGAVDNIKVISVTPTFFFTGTDDIRLCSIKIIIESL